MFVRACQSECGSQFSPPGIIFIVIAPNTEKGNLLLIDKLNCCSLLAVVAGSCVALFRRLLDADLLLRMFPKP